MWLTLKSDCISLCNCTEKCFDRIFNRIGLEITTKLTYFADLIFFMLQKFSYSKIGFESEKKLRVTYVRKLF